MSLSRSSPASKGTLHMPSEMCLADSIDLDVMRLIFKLIFFFYSETNGWNNCCEIEAVYQLLMWQNSGSTLTLQLMLYVSMQKKTKKKT